MFSPCVACQAHRIQAFLLTLLGLLCSALRRLMPVATAQPWTGFAFRHPRASVAPRSWACRRLFCSTRSTSCPKTRRRRYHTRFSNLRWVDSCSRVDPIGYWKPPTCDLKQLGVCQAAVFLRHLCSSYHWLGFLERVIESLRKSAIVFFFIRVSSPAWQHTSLSPPLSPYPSDRSPSPASQGPIS